MDGTKHKYGESITFNGANVCPCDLASPEECRICEDRLNASLVESQQELIQKLFFENQLSRQAIEGLRNK